MNRKIKFGKYEIQEHIKSGIFLYQKYIIRKNIDFTKMYSFNKKNVLILSKIQKSDISSTFIVLMRE